VIVGVNRLILGFLFLVCTDLGALAQTLKQIPDDVPVRPDPQMTPGALCERANALRYPEKIRYCERQVASEIKDQVFANYQSAYRMHRYSRHQFKIDHYIPLCMGGSNHPSNLWPQHLSISAITDKVEEYLCTAMKLGRAKQATAIQTLRQAKHDLNYALRLSPQLEMEFGVLTPKSPF
jgi:hypothetical protein